MGVNFRWLINVGLLALPIAVTLGILLGLQKHRDDTGQPPLFSPPSNPGDGNTTPHNNKITEKEYCQRFFGITPDTNGQQYTLNPNQWGWTPGKPGHLCMNVSTFNNNTYPTKFTAPEWSVTWQYPADNVEAPVHAFPNIKIDGDILPATIQSLKEVNLNLEWTYGVGNDTASETDVQSLKDISVNANVAIDMFFDADQKKAADSAKAKYEVMVWFADIGPATQPIGTTQNIDQTIDGTTFTLWAGTNDATQQTVLTWVASQPAGKFHGDIAPLLSQITQSSTEEFPTPSHYLGYLAMGSETYSSLGTVTFHVPSLSIDIESSS